MGVGFFLFENEWDEFLERFGLRRVGVVWEVVCFMEEFRKVFWESIFVLSFDGFW